MLLNEECSIVSCSVKILAVFPIMLGDACLTFCRFCKALISLTVVLVMQNV